MKIDSCEHAAQALRLLTMMRIQMHHEFFLSNLAIATVSTYSTDASSHGSDPLLNVLGTTFKHTRAQ